MTNLNEKVRDHFENPRNVGSLDKRSQSVGTGVGRAGECGDVMRLQIEIDKDRRICDAKFKTFGCSAAIAVSSFTTEWLKGKSLSEAQSLTNQFVAHQLDLPEEKRHCSVLAEDALREALQDLQQKQGVSESCDAPAACRKPLSLTRNAAQRVRKLFAMHDLPDSACLRIRVNPGADNQDAYELDVARQADSDDEVFESFGVNVVCDSDSYLRLAGMEVDYNTQFMQRGFVFRHPGVGTCACGRGEAHQ